MITVYPFQGLQLRNAFMEMEMQRLYKKVHLLHLNKRVRLDSARKHLKELT